MTNLLGVPGVNEMCGRAEYVFNKFTLKAKMTLYHESVPSAEDFYK